MLFSVTLSFVKILRHNPIPPGRRGGIDQCLFGRSFQMFFRHFFLPFFQCFLLSVFDVLFPFELALFANNGCYSHDVMLREVGESFEALLHDGSVQNDDECSAPSHFSVCYSPNCTVYSNLSSMAAHRIHWVQLFMYDFGFGDQLRRPSHWNSLVMESAQTDADSRTLMERGSQLLWEVTVPFDHNRPWDWRGAFLLYEVIRRNQQNCEHFVKSAKFRKFRENSRVDLVVVDHFLQCFTVAAFLLNASVTIQFSNWPIADGYISSLNIPASPAAYPKTSTPFSAREMRSFSVRLRNSLFHALISFVRFLQCQMIARFFASVELFHGRHEVRLEQVEAAQLFYAGRAEFIAEPVRPISNRIKHFGCAHCQRESRKMGKDKGKGIDTKKSAKIENGPPKFGWSSQTVNGSSPSPSWKEYCGCNGTLQKTNFGKYLLIRSNVRQQFPLINWDEIEKCPFVLVSFGSIAKVEFMPEELFRSFLRAFSNFPSLIFVWQTNSEPNVILNGKKCKKLPQNVRIVRWAPIKTLLAHPNLYYAILHGGVNTVNEALIYGGKPILGLPLQGDQPSNLQRLVDLGMAVQLDIGQVWRGQLSPKMALIEQNYARFAHRAQQITAMIRTYRNGIGSDQQTFWLRWVANKPFLRQTAHKFFHLRYRPSIEYYALSELSTALAFLLFIFLLLF